MAEREGRESHQRGAYNGLHAELDNREAACAYVLSKGFEYTPKDVGDVMNSNPEVPCIIAETLNGIWRNNRTGAHITSLMRHIAEDNLTLADFLDGEIDYTPVSETCY